MSLAARYSAGRCFSIPRGLAHPRTADNSLGLGAGLTTTHELSSREDQRPSPPRQAAFGLAQGVSPG